MKYILALDQGTTSSRAVLFDENQNIAGISQREFAQIYPKEGWVEHDPMDIFTSQYSVLLDVIAKTGVSPKEILAIGIANQRETVIMWDKTSGEPIYNAIVWQCRRTAGIVEKLVADGLGGYIREKTGLVPDAYFSGTKIKWILDHVDGAREKAVRGQALFGTVDTWLIWRLTAGRAHVTDYTNASRTMIYDIRKLEWDKTLLEALDIPAACLPEVIPSSGVCGYAAVGGVKIPVAGIAGDQQAALFGQCCFEPGESKSTYGTGCFLLTNTGGTPAESRNGLLTTVAASVGGEINYALEGSVFTGGAVVQWLRDELHLIDESADTEYFAAKAASTGGVYLVPAFTGLGVPYWDMRARGCIIGITRGTKREHIVRAAVESIAYQTCGLVDAIKKDAGISLSALKADGGASRNKFLMQFQADLLGIPVVCPTVSESTALGAAYLAGLAAGMWSGTKELTKFWKPGHVYAPQMDGEDAAKLLAGWDKAVGRSLGWAE
ncbi:MAG: glycerol kinase GlpK [Oscillospiraceae bacterium]|nr:glycerol kinase GlpK [Oscillospiraceae bacterium]